MMSHSPTFSSHPAVGNAAGNETAKERRLLLRRSLDCAIMDKYYPWMFDILFRKYSRTRKDCAMTETPFDLSDKALAAQIPEWHSVRSFTDRPIEGKVRAATGPGQKLACVIALGYGVTAGQPHKIKTPEQVVRNGAGAPSWFDDGVRAALLAPTAMNQQKFTIGYDGGRVLIRSLGGPYSAMDLGIVKTHFELGAEVEGRRRGRETEGHS